MTSRAARAPLRRLDSRVSRRGLLGGGVLAGVLAASGVPVAARAGGGTLRLALAGPLPRGAEGWDTRAASLLGVAAGLVAETPAEVGPEGQLLPGLARAWEADGVARLWRLHLDPLARFHDGAPLRPRDVAASLMLHREGPLASLLARVAELREDGPHALLLSLREGDPDLPLRLASPRLAVWRGGHPDGVGTGPYRLDPQAPPGTLRALRVPGHRREAGFFEVVEVRALPDPHDRLRALLAGEADAVDLLPPDLEALALAAGARLAAPGEPGGEPWASLAPLLGAEDPARTLHAPALAHGPVSGLGPLDGGRIAERWWREG